MTELMEMAGLSWREVKPLLVGASGGLLAILMNHWLALWREKRKHQREQDAAAEKRTQELKEEAARRLDALRFICTGLIPELEKFARRCHNEMFESNIDVRDASTWPELKLEGSDVYRAALPHDVLYELHELREVYRHSLQEIAYIVEHSPAFISPVMLKAPNAAAGLKTTELAMRLRQECGFPDSPLTGSPFSIHNALEQQHNISVNFLNSGPDYIMHPITATLSPDLPHSDPPSPKPLW